MRQYKRLAAGTLDPEKAKAYRAKARDAQRAVREFVARHGDVLRRDYWREREDGFANSAIHGTMGRSSGKPGALPPPSVPVKIGHIDYNDDAQVENQFREFIEKYSDSPVENTRIIAENGDVYEAAGGEKRMIFEGMDDILYHAKSIHNHPTGESEYSFSSNRQDDDIPSFLAERGAVMEAFDEEYRYRFEQPKSVTLEQWNTEYEYSDNWARALLNAEGYTIDDDVSKLRQHYRIRETCRHLNIKESYRRWRR